MRTASGNGVARHNEGRSRVFFEFSPMRRRLFTRENLLAVLLCLLIVLLLIVATDSSPQWIYQGF